MNTADTEASASTVLPSIVVLLFILGYLVSGYLTLDQTTRFVPLLAGSVTLVLLLVDIARILLSRRNKVTDEAESRVHGAHVTFHREVLAITFVVAGVVAIYTIGFLAAIPFYLFASIAYLGRQSLRTASIVTLLTSLAIYLIFEVALAYELFPGVFFS